MKCISIEIVGGRAFITTEETIFRWFRKPLTVRRHFRDVGDVSVGNWRWVELPNTQVSLHMDYLLNEWLCDYLYEDRI